MRILLLCLIERHNNVQLNTVITFQILYKLLIAKSYLMISRSIYKYLKKFIFKYGDYDLI